MKNIHHEIQKVEPRPGYLTPAGAWLVRRRRVPTSLANVIAEMAFRSGTQASHG